MISDDRCPLCQGRHGGALAHIRGVAEAPSPAKRLLVVEDEPAIAELLAYNLTKQGHSVATVHDGVAALEALASFRPDLLVLDLLLPLKSGWQVLRQIRNHPEPAIAKLPVIVVSALAGERLARELAANGAPYLLGKPFSVTELCDLVARLLVDSGRDPSESGFIETSFDRHQRVISRS